MGEGRARSRSFVNFPSLVGDLFVDEQIEVLKAENKNVWGDWISLPNPMGGVENLLVCLH